jgi:hypothetical protein
MTKRLLYGLGVLAVLSGLAACDAGFGGELLGNQPPDTFLAVRDTSLVERICTPTPTGPVCSDDDDLFTSTVFVSWGGTDPDGFVVRFELRYYDSQARPGPEDLWTSTTRRDTLILLPIPPGRTTAAVAFEVRAVDNEGAKDPTPARTVFPIINSPPSLRLTRFELPPDTTWTVFSFAWDAMDPDGADDIAGIEVAFNDPSAFVRLPASARFVSFRAEGAQPGAATADARVFLGRGFTPHRDSSSPASGWTPTIRSTSARWIGRRPPAPPSPTRIPTRARCGSSEAALRARSSSSTTTARRGRTR